MIWHNFEAKKPKEYQLVFLQFEEWKGLPQGVSIGYLKKYPDYDLIVTPGMPRGDINRKVETWAKLPKDFSCPFWPGFDNKL